MTTTPLDELAHLDWPTPAVPCQHLTSDEECAHPATWHVTVAILDTTGRPIAHVDGLFCDHHHDWMHQHHAECPNCPRLMRIVGEERIA